MENDSMCPAGHGLRRVTAVPTLLLVSLLLVGLTVTPAGAATEGEHHQEARWAQYTLTDCEELVVNRFVDPEQLPFALPDGWEYYLLDGQPSVYSYAWECQRGGRTVREVFEMVRVEAPAEDLGGEDLFGFVLLHGYTNTVRNWLQWRSWGFDSLVGPSLVRFSLSEDQQRASATAWGTPGLVRLRTHVTQDFIPDIPGGTSAVIRLDRDGNILARAYWQFSDFSVGPGDGLYARGRNPLRPTGPGGAVFVAPDGEDYTYTFSRMPPGAQQ